MLKIMFMDLVKSFDGILEWLIQRCSKVIIKIKMMKNKNLNDNL